MRKIIFGIDAAFRNFGLVIIDVTDDFEILHHEVIKTERAKKKSNIRVSVDDFENIQKITTRIQSLLDTLCYIDDKIIFIAELPTGASQAAIPARLMGFVIAIVACVTTLYHYPCIAVDPRESKENLTRSKSATKDQMMKAICDEFGQIYEKKIKGKSSRYSIEFFGKKYGSDFEHVADAIAAVLQAQQTNQYSIWNQ